MIRVLVNGAHGRMGCKAVKAIDADEALALVGTCVKGEDLAEKISQTSAQVVVDLTVAGCAYAHTDIILEGGAHPVIGTSGLVDEEIKALQEKAQAKKCGGVIAPNFSISAVLAMQCAAQIARYLPQVEIIELHHDKKVDAPSATALKTAEVIANAREKTLEPPLMEEKHTLKGSRGAVHHGIPIHAVRLQGVLAQEQIIFGSASETLSIHHNTLNRQCFMPGIVMACKKVVALDELYYGLENLL